MKISGSRLSRDKAGLAGLLLFLLVAVAPIVWCVGYAIAYSLGLAGFLRRGFTLHYWATSIGGGEVVRSFLFSGGVAVAVVVIGAACAITIVLGFREELRRGYLASLLYAPLALSGLVAAFLISRWLSGAGFVSRLGHSLGWVRDPQHFANLVNDPLGLGIIAAHLLLAIPFFALAMLQVYEIEKLDELRILATSLGASTAQSRWRVAIPILLRKSSATLLLYFIFVLGSFEIPLVVGPQNPPMISLLTRRKFGLYELTQKPEAFVIATIYTVILLLLLSLIFRRSEERTT